MEISFLVKPQDERVIMDFHRAVYQKIARKINQFCMLSEKLKDARVIDSKIKYLDWIKYFKLWLRQIMYIICGF